MLFFRSLCINLFLLCLCLIAVAQDVDFTHFSFHTGYTLYKVAGNHNGETLNFGNHIRSRYGIEDVVISYNLSSGFKFSKKLISEFDITFTTAFKLQYSKILIKYIPQCCFGYSVGYFQYKYDIKGFGDDPSLNLNNYFFMNYSPDIGMVDKGGIVGGFYFWNQGRFSSKASLNGGLLVSNGFFTQAYFKRVNSNQRIMHRYEAEKSLSQFILPELEARFWFKREENDGFGISLMTNCLFARKRYNYTLTKNYWFIGNTEPEQAIKVKPVLLILPSISIGLFRSF